MRFITREKAQTLPSLVGLNDAQRARLVEFSSTLYDYVRANEFASEATIRTWAEAQGVTNPDVVTRAIAFLGETGQLLGVGDVGGAALAGARGVLEELDKPQLLDMAREADIEGRSKMSKDELVEALAARSEAEGT